MNIIELAKDYQRRGWFTDMTSEEIEKEIANLRAEIKRVDKRTYNGRATKIFNQAKIAIAKIILEANEEIANVA